MHVLVVTTILPSLLLSPAIRWQLSHSPASLLQMQIAAVEESAEVIDVEGAAGPKYSDEEQIIRQYAESWSRVDQEKLAGMPDAFDTSQESTSVKKQLIGSWKLVAASDADCIRSVGLSGRALTRFQSVIGHFQTFAKPDPMDIFTGKSSFFMTTSEVIADAKIGVTSTVTMKGGFYVGPLADTELGVTETYSCVEVDGAAQPGAGMSNRWDFKFLSDTLRVCRAVDGSLRVYEKLEADVALAELASLRTEEIEIDPEAFMEDEVEVEDEPEDDPNDDRPIWQKRLDEEARKEGRYGGRTKDGTPINNFGPPPSNN